MPESERFAALDYRSLPGIKPKKLSKEELKERIKLAKNGDQNAYEDILGHMHNYLCYLTKEFFIQGAEAQDVYQEGCIKLLNVIEKYDESKTKGGGFVSFAQSSIRKHIITTINKEMAKKRVILNTSFSLDDSTRNENGEVVSYMDTITGDRSDNISNIGDPLDIVQKDYEDFLVEEISKNLSDMESKVFVLRFMEGNSYKEIAQELCLYKRKNKKALDTKAVDNSIWRSRPKIKKTLEKLMLSSDLFSRPMRKKSRKRRTKQTESKKWKTIGKETPKPKRKRGRSSKNGNDKKL